LSVSFTSYSTVAFGGPSYTFICSKVGFLWMCPINKFRCTFQMCAVSCWVGPLSRRDGADGIDGLQIWRVAANMLNMQSRTADKGRSSSLEVGRRANDSSNQLTPWL
jgi:hypothetical protein